MIVGTTMTSMMARALSRIWILAAPIGPCGSSTPPEQPASSKSKVAAFAIRENNFGRFDAGQSHHRQISNFRWIELPIPLRPSGNEVPAAFPPMVARQFRRLVRRMLRSRTDLDCRVS